MTVKNARYKVLSSSGYDEYHFETNNGQVKILDKNKNLLGTLKEFAFEGRTVTTGKISEIQVSGLYKVKGITGLPANIASTETAILQVLAIGDIGKPDMIYYQLISNKGSVYNKTTVPGANGTETSWSTGGTDLDNTISKIISNFGDATKLNTQSKTSAVSAINEVNTNLKATQKDLNDLEIDYTTFKQHNHDDRYIYKYGDTVKGSLVLDSGAGFQSNGPNGTFLNMFIQNNAGEYDLGNVDTAMNLWSKNVLLHNGKKIWTEVNHGANSGLDADKLDGVHAAEFPKLSVANTFAQKQTFTSGIKVGTPIEWNNGTAGFDSVGNFNINTATKVFFSKTGDLNAHGLALSNSSSEARIIFNGNSTDDIAFFRSINQNEELWLHHFTSSGNGSTFFKASTKDHVVRFENEIGIKGRKLYLQSGQPSGSIPNGSIWIS